MTDLCFIFLAVSECKALYKSLRDAHRYRRNKLSGKSGDSGDDTWNDDSESTNSDGFLSHSFLLPTASKFARKTLTFGGAPTATTTVAAAAAAKEAAVQPVDVTNDSGMLTLNSSRNGDMFSDDELNKMMEDEANADKKDKYDCPNSSVYSFVSGCYFLLLLLLSNYHYSFVVISF